MKIQYREYKINFDPKRDNKLIVSGSTITTAIHLAAHMGAKYIILLGHDCGTLDGENNFLKKCKKSGVNGLIVVDLPWPENKIFSKKCKKNSIDFIQLLSPTTSKKRLKSITKN